MAILTIRLKAFGIAKEIIGSREILFEMEQDTACSQIKLLLQKKFPELSGLRSFALAVNGAYGADDQIICAGDEVAIIPPVSGG